MATSPLDPKLLRDALAAVEQYGGISPAARALGMPYATFQHRVMSARSAVRHGKLIPPAKGEAVETEEDRQAIPKGLPFERAWSEWMQFIGAAQDRYAGPARPRAKTGRLRVVAAADFHIPYHSKKALATLIAREGPQTDILLVGGDFGDVYAASTFTKHESVPFDVEHAEKTLVMQQLSEAFPLIYFLEESNHSDRIEKRLRENLSRDLLAAVSEMTGGILNPEVMLCKRFPNVKIANWVTPQNHKLGWFTVIGDVAYCHAEQYSRVPGAVLRSLQERLDDNQRIWGLPKLRAVVQFHTHSMAWLPWRSDMVLVEPGCMCEPMTYQSRAKGGGRPQRVGYVVMDFVDGAVDINSVSLRWLDVENEAA